MTCGLFHARHCPLGLQEGGAKDKEHHPERAGGIQPQGHRRHVEAALAPAQPQGHPEVHQVADQDTDRGARNHVPDSEVCRKFKNDC